MKFLIILILSISVGGCVLPSNQSYSHETFDKNTHGIVMFRTVNTCFETNTGVCGFLVKFKNIDTGEEIINIRGPWGFAKEKDYVLAFPEGKYELSEVFFYNGSMFPDNNGYKLEVESGKIIYIGTIAKSWAFPEEYNYAVINNDKKYKRETGAWFGDKYIKASVYIIDENLSVEGFKLNNELSLPFEKKLLK